MSLANLLNKKCTWKRRLNKDINDYGEIIYSDVTIGSDVNCARQVGRGLNARQLIETYKSSRLKLVDENIVAMLERTLSLVLVKKLSLKEQTDLVY